MKLLKIKRKIKIKNKDDYINKEHAYKIFLGGDKYSKNISDNTNKIKSEDFGGDKYSKNIKGLGGVRTAIFVKITLRPFNNINDQF